MSSGCQLYHSFHLNNTGQGIGGTRGNSLINHFSMSGRARPEMLYGGEQVCETGPNVGVEDADTEVLTRNSWG